MLKQNLKINTDEVLSYSQQHPHAKSTTASAENSGSNFYSSAQNSPQITQNTHSNHPTNPPERLKTLSQGNKNTEQNINENQSQMDFSDFDIIAQNQNGKKLYNSSIFNLPLVSREKREIEKLFPSAEKQKPQGPIDKEQFKEMMINRFINRKYNIRQDNEIQNLTNERLRLEKQFCRKLYYYTPEDVDFKMYLTQELQNISQISKYYDENHVKELIKEPIDTKKYWNQHFKNTYLHEEYMYYYSKMKETLDAENTLAKENGNGYSFKLVQHEFEKQWRKRLIDITNNLDPYELKSLYFVVQAGEAANDLTKKQLLDNAVAYLMERKTDFQQCYQKEMKENTKKLARIIHNMQDLREDRLKMANMQSVLTKTQCLSAFNRMKQNTNSIIKQVQKKTLNIPAIREDDREHGTKSTDAGKSGRRYIKKSINQPKNPIQQQQILTDRSRIESNQSFVKSKNRLEPNENCNNKNRNSFHPNPRYSNISHITNNNHENSQRQVQMSRNNVENEELNLEQYQNQKDLTKDQKYSLSNMLEEHINSILDLQETEDKMEQELLGQASKHSSRPKSQHGRHLSVQQQDQNIYHSSDQRQKQGQQGSFVRHSCFQQGFNTNLSPFQDNNNQGKQSGQTLIPFGDINKRNNNSKNENLPNISVIQKKDSQESDIQSRAKSSQKSQRKRQSKNQNSVSIPLDTDQTSKSKKSNMTQHWNQFMENQENQQQQEEQEGNLISDFNINAKDNEVGSDEKIGSLNSSVAEMPQLDQQRQAKLRMTTKLASVNSLQKFLHTQNQNQGGYTGKINDIILKSTLVTYENYIGKNNWEVLSTNKEEQVIEKAQEISQQKPTRELIRGLTQKATQILKHGSTMIAPVQGSGSRMQSISQTDNKNEPGQYEENLFNNRDLKPMIKNNSLVNIQNSSIHIVKQMNDISDNACYKLINTLMGVEEKKVAYKERKKEHKGQVIIKKCEKILSKWDKQQISTFNYSRKELNERVKGIRSYRYKACKLTL